MYLREILFYLVTAWIASMIGSKHRKKYIQFMNSEASDSQKKVHHLWHIISVIAWVAIVLAAIYFGCTHN